MSFIIVLGVLFVILFAFPYVTKRRFGTLGLSLAAGWLLSDLWARDAARLVSDAGLTLTTPPLQSVVSAALTIVPALLVLHRGPVYHSKLLRLLGSGLFALMAVCLLLGPLETALVIEGSGRALYDLLAQNKSLIVTVGLCAAILDVFLTKGTKGHGEHGRH